MRDKGQVLFFNEAELKLIKQTFADNEALLYTVRKVLLQFPLTPAEKELIKQAITPEVFAVIKKRLLPDLDADAPLTQIGDYRVLLTQDLKSKTTEELAPVFESREIEMNYIEQQLAQLSDIEAVLPEPTIKLVDLRDMGVKSDEEIHAEMMAYLNLLGYIDPQLNYLKIIAGQAEETPEEQRARLQRDSNQ